ncbi:hypothetical protein FHW83_004975 [Duganella sp. SG902]|uniref:hypothetical protein n=1 Tax=Duganella sp. SG902 TaxID=2587016 RepID=UPI00159E4A49|nr:hypothetical protein [Duganella sp. SG902]NVM79138.1 hypothetical protein [Duganella sp. SG902]
MLHLLDEILAKRLEAPPADLQLRLRLLFEDSARTYEYVLGRLGERERRGAVEIDAVLAATMEECRAKLAELSRRYPAISIAAG